MPIFNPSRTLNCRGRLIVIERPLVMGILNVTPDSFYAGGRHPETAGAIQHAERMLEEGADIIDVGGMSSRPGADSLSPAEELERVIPVIDGIIKDIPEVVISVDTVHAEVAEAAVDAGASVVNDISAGNMDGDMLKTVGKLNVPYVAMHMQGTPQTMQNKPHYDDIAVEILDYFIKRIQACMEAGIGDIIIDPGFGFGKTMAHNYELLRRMEVFRIIDAPLLVGASRKSMIYHLLGTTPGQALNGTTAVNMFALSKGASILRVHDVKEAVETVRIFEAIMASKD